MGKARLSLAGKRFGRLVAIEDGGPHASKRRLWRCQCDCGGEALIPSSYLVSGNTKSCGCYAKSGDFKVTHGHTRGAKPSRAHLAWSNMKDRCTNQNRPQWKDWGGRGITYDSRWESFEAFLSDMGEPPLGMSLDRRDNNGNYCKENCRWATRVEQRLNSRQITMISSGAETLCVRDWERKLGLKRGILTMRLRRGMPVDRALSPKRLHRSRPGEV